MNPRLASVCMLLTSGLLAAVLVGCGSGGDPEAQALAEEPGVRPLAMVSLPLTNALAPSGDYRWGDIAGNL